MSSSLQNLSGSILSGRCYGRVIEVVCANEKTEDSSSENYKNILVLIKDRMYTLDYRGDAEILEGFLISFEIGEKGEVVILETIGTNVNIEAEGD